MRHIRRILVAISDPSASPQAAVAKGARIAKACHAQLEIFHSTRLDGIARAEAKALFESALAARDIPRTRRHLVGNSPDNAIEQVARRTRADIVVMGALSRSGLKRLFIGDTAERLLDELPCDVLIVKPQQFICRIPTRCNGPRLLARIA